MQLLVSLGARVNATDVLGGTYTPHCAAINPARLVRSLARSVVASGVILHENTRVTAIEPGIVRTDHGSVRAEYIVRANPDLIMVGQGSADGLTQRPGWHSIRAVRERRVCVFPAEQANVLVRPGPRMAEAARLMAQCLTDKAPQLAVAGARP